MVDGSKGLGVCPAMLRILLVQKGQTLLTGCLGRLVGADRPSSIWKDVQAGSKEHLPNLPDQFPPYSAAVDTLGSSGIDPPAMD